MKSGSTEDPTARRALDLLEEAVHLLRANAAAVLPAYYIGALPFVLALLFFWADMSRNPFAAPRCLPASLALAVLFVWWKGWQCVFATQVGQCRRGESATFPSVPAWCRTAGRQLMLQPLGLLVLPVAILLTFPLGWALAFYQNLCALDEGRRCPARTLAAEAWEQAKLWPAQNHRMLGMLSVAALLVFLNVGIGLLTLPPLLRMLLGLETVFARSGIHMLNTTFLSVVLGLTFLLLDPLLKTLYALRCFYGRSRRSGDDLRVAFRRRRQWRERAAAGVTMLVLAAALGQPKAAAAATRADSRGEQRQAAVRATRLERAARHVLERPEYAWRLPREAKPETPEGALAAFVRAIRETLQAVRRTVARGLQWLADRLNRLFPGRGPDVASRLGLGWVTGVHLLVGGLLVVLLASIALFAWRLRRVRRMIVEATAVSAARTPDLNDESVAADELPGSGWRKLAAELLTRQEFRLALRAYYLAILAELAQQRLITIARYKSNRDYRVELSRRAHAAPDAVAAFGEATGIVDRVWYGSHPATGELLAEFKMRMRRILRHAEQA